MANHYKFSFIPVAPAQKDPLDPTVEYPARRLDKQIAFILADDEPEARERLSREWTLTNGSLEEVILLSVF